MGTHLQCRIWRGHLVDEASGTENKKTGLIMD